jgi:hypothetical protein
LDGERAFYRVDYAGELDERSVAHQLDDAAVVVSDPGIDQLVPMPLDRGERTHLVRLHKARVSDHIGRQYRGKAALHGNLPRARLYRRCGWISMAAADCSNVGSWLSAA